MSGQLGWIRLTWGTSLDRETHNTYVVVTPVKQTIERAVQEAVERMVSMMAYDHIASMTAQPSEPR